MCVLVCVYVNLITLSLRVCTELKDEADELFKQALFEHAADSYGKVLELLGEGEAYARCLKACMYCHVYDHMRYRKYVSTYTDSCCFAVMWLLRVPVLVLSINPRTHGNREAVLCYNNRAACRLQIRDYGAVIAEYVCVGGIERQPTSSLERISNWRFDNRSSDGIDHGSSGDTGI